MTRHAGANTTTRGVGSLIAIVAILTVPPVLLVAAVGWPLPSSLPSGDDIERALRFGPDDAVIVGTLAVLAWLIWAQVALALVVEIVAVARGRARVRLPILPGTQALAGHLAAGLMLLAVSHPGTAAAASAAPGPVVITELDDTYAPPDLHIAAPVRTDASPSEPTTALVPTITVQRHDTYWGIAERTLGDGSRWRQIHDLNVGRTMADGHTIGATDDLLRPGWTLRLPADATTATAADGAAPDAGTIVVEPGDHLWGIATDALAERLERPPTPNEIDPYWRELIDTNRPRLVDPGNPNLIHRGQTLTLPVHDDPAEDAPPLDPAMAPSPTPEGPEPPASAGPANAETAPTPPTTPADSTPAPSVAGSPRSAPATRSSTDTDTETDRRGLIAAGGLASAAMAVGLTTAVRTRRRRFLTDHPGRLHATTPRSDRHVHRAAVANSDPEPIEDLRGALGALAEQLAATNGVARPRIVQHSPAHLDIYLDEPRPETPDGWIAQADGAIWTLDTSAPTSGSRTCAAPLLVTLGQPDEDGQIYLDLEADGLISLVGDPDAARGLARSILTELSFGPLTDSIQILVVGDLVDVRATTLDHVSLLDTWDEAAASLTEWTQGSHAALEANGWPNTFVARGHDEYHDALSPLLVVAAKPPPADVVDLLAHERPAAIAVVVADEVPNAPVTIDCRAERLTVLDVGLSCVPQDLDDDTFAAITSILLAAETPDDQADDPTENGPTSSEATSLEDAEAPALIEPDHSILVRVLGEIRVEGTDRPLTPKLTAALAYVALHRSVSVETLEEACWPQLGSSARQRMRDAMSECRRLVGSQHLPPATSGHYEVRPSVITDADLFDLRVTHAAKLPPEEAVDFLRSALALVTGKVFTLTTLTEISPDLLTETPHL